MIYVREFGKFLADIYRSRWLLLELTKNDFKSRYLGSYPGVVWVFAKPAMTLAILWLVAGLTPWFFIFDCLTGGATGARAVQSPRTAAALPGRVRTRLGWPVSSGEPSGDGSRH